MPRSLISTPRKRVGGVDQVLIELAPVGADLFDLAFERGFGFGGFALLIARRFEFLVALLERVEFLCVVVLREQGRPLLRYRLLQQSVTGNTNPSPATSAARGSRAPNPPRQIIDGSRYACRFERQD